MMRSIGFAVRLIWPGHLVMADLKNEAEKVFRNETTPIVAKASEASKPELRPELRQIVERNWPRDEEALRYLGR
jgi:hypothetical protein